MRKTLFIGLLMFLQAGFAAAEAADRATQEEARAMALAASTHLRSAGPDKAFADFEDRNSPFHDRDLYVFVQDFECNFHAHGLNPDLKGRNIWNLRNPNGRFACQDIVNVTRKHGEGWTEYIFQDPISGKLAWKRTFSIAVDGYIVMVGAYLRAANPDETIEQK